MNKNSFLEKNSNILVIESLHKTQEVVFSQKYTKNIKYSNRQGR
ncbi:hypothetical protein NSP_39940 [Nodularia spumigena CCY9414]|nr:hypothetical protein NSP_39940 [Nodularia spumigena CCY9414]